MPNATTNYDFLSLEIKNSIASITLNNPKKTNAINELMWREIKEVFEKIHSMDKIKVCILKSNAKHFSSGIDINFLISIMEKLEKLPKEKRSEALYDQIKNMQESMNAIEKCAKPVIAAIHGLCVGGAVDLIAACDIRLATYTSLFSIMETKLGIVADMGTLQRLPYIISDSHLKEFSLTSNFFSGYKAKKIGMINHNYFCKKSLHKAAYKLATHIASLPSVAVQGSKQTINAMKAQQIETGLSQIAKLNSHLLLSDETRTALDKVKNRISNK